MEHFSPIKRCRELLELLTWAHRNGVIDSSTRFALHPGASDLRELELFNLLGSLQKGDEVVTTGGIAGKITKVSDAFVVLEVSDTVEMKFQKGAIAATLPKGTLKAI
ncbi:preprotein translocase subunit YajC [Pantoea sp. SIMBA_072]